MLTVVFSHLYHAHVVAKNTSFLSYHQEIVDTFLTITGKLEQCQLKRSYAEQKS